MPPATEDRRWRGGRADRRQIQVLVLTARYLRRRRGPTASVFGRMPLASDPPHLFRSPQTKGVSECAGWYSNMRNAATLRKPCEFPSKKLPWNQVPKFRDLWICGAGADGTSSRGSSSRNTSCLERTPLPPPARPAD